jgi:hypothetical protein
MVLTKHGFRPVATPLFSSFLFLEAIGSAAWAIGYHKSLGTYGSLIGTFDVAGMVFFFCTTAVLFKAADDHEDVWAFAAAAAGAFIVLWLAPGWLTLSNLNAAPPSDVVGVSLGFGTAIAWGLGALIAAVCSLRAEVVGNVTTERSLGWRLLFFAAAPAAIVLTAWPMLMLVPTVVQLICYVVLVYHVERVEDNVEGEHPAPTSEPPAPETAGEETPTGANVSSMVGGNNSSVTKITSIGLAHAPQEEAA